jgi:hypothetical protein
MQRTFSVLNAETAETAEKTPGFLSVVCELWVKT